MSKLRALVADDEYAARETLRRLVNWADFGFDPPVAVSNGQQALDAYRKDRFDLVLTDIEMPVMNGIALIEAIRALNPQQAIVIVSCHEKFEYARRALQLGVGDYFIKDLLTEKELTAFLSQLAPGFGGPRPEPGPRRSALDDALRSAASGAQPIVPAPPAPGFEAASVFAVMIDDYESQCMAAGEEVCMAQIAAFAEEADCLAHYYPGGDICYLLYEVPNVPSTLYYYTSVIGFAGAARTAAKKHGIRSCTIGISNLITRPERMAEACGQAREAARMRIVTGQGKSILYDTIALRQSALDFGQTDRLLRLIEDFAHHANTASLHLIDKLYEVELPSSFADLHYYRYVNARLWALTLMVARAQGRDEQRLLRSVGASVEVVNRMEDSSEMSGFFKSCLLTLFAEDDTEENDNLVNRALRLIEREYTADISLSDVADKLHTNKSYISRLFKEKTGESVMNYIMKKKIARVKQLLLNTPMKLYEISDSVSIASPQYLSTVFKRYTGLSPNEYKRAHLE